MPITPVGLDLPEASSVVEHASKASLLGAQSKSMARPTRNSMPLEPTPAPPRTRVPTAITHVGLDISPPPTPKEPIQIPVAPPAKKPRASLPPAAVPNTTSVSHNELWLTRSHDIPPDRLNGWVVSWVLESFLKEDEVTKACEKASLDMRLEQCGFLTLKDSTVGPRRKCQALQQATEMKHTLVAEIGQRYM